MPITPATMTPIRNKTPTTIKTTFKAVLPEVVGGGGTFGYGGLGGMGAPALIGIPRVFSCCSLNGTRLLQGGVEVDKKKRRVLVRRGSAQRGQRGRSRIIRGSRGRRVIFAGGTGGAEPM